jgi:UDP-glucuronate 4-epimerase
MKVLVTGAAGFIGSAVALKLLKRGDTVVGIDNVNDYYSVELKSARLQRTEKHKAFTFCKIDVKDHRAMELIFNKQCFDSVVHLAAQAGVRYSLENPRAYIDSNIVGFANILECCRLNEVGHLVYASSSSVYGANTSMPLSVRDNVDHPLSLYAATKKSNELMAHAYSNLYNLPTTGLRFFTVYGPWGRPDMALFLFTKAILAGEKIPVFNYGKHTRDFTYIDDIVDGVVRVLDKTAMSDPGYDCMNPDPGSSKAPWLIHNIGRGKSVELLEYIELIEEATGKKADLDLLPMQNGDIPDTIADVSTLQADIEFVPTTTPRVGVNKFVEWYRDFYKV